MFPFNHKFNLLTEASLRLLSYFKIYVETEILYEIASDLKVIKKSCSGRFEVRNFDDNFIGVQKHANCVKNT